MKYRLPIYAAVILLTAATASAQAPKLLAPDGPVEPYRMARLSIDPPPESAAWVIFPTGTSGEVDLEISEDGKRVAFVAPPGSYMVIASLLYEGKPVLLNAQVRINGKAPAPGPVIPEPDNPAPPPPPAPRTDVEKAAYAYSTAVEQAFISAAEQIEAGKIKTTTEAVQFVLNARQDARDKLGEAIDKAVAPLHDATGTITDPKAYAELLKDIAAAMSWGEKSLQLLGLSLGGADAVASNQEGVY